MPVLTLGANTGDSGGCADNWMQASSGDTNRSTVSPLQVFRYGATNINNSLIQFSGLDAIPSGSTINSATLRLTVDNGSGVHDQVVYRMLPAVVISESTYNSRSSGNSWNTAGALGSGTDRSATPEDTITTGSVITAGTEFDFDVATGVGVVVGASGSTITFGVFNEAGDDFRGVNWVAVEGADADRPRLIVDYTEPAGGETGDMADVADLSATFVAAKSVAAAVSEQMNLSGTQSAMAAALAVVVESIDLADSDGGLAGAAGSIADAAALSGQMQAIAVAVAAISAALELGETWAGESDVSPGAIVDETALSAVFVAAVQAYSAISEGFEFSDAWSAQAAAQASIDDELNEDGITDTIELADSIASVAATFASTADALTLGAVLAAAAASVSSITDAVDLDDAWASMSVAIASVAETISISAQFAADSGIGSAAVSEDFDLTVEIAAIAGALTSILNDVEFTASFTSDAVTVAAITFGLALGDSFTTTSSTDQDPAVGHFVRAVAAIRPIRVAGINRAIRPRRPSSLN